MKATQGNLRIDQSYKLIGSEYRGKFLEGAIPSQCENCGLSITNIATVEGSIDKRSYCIGLDCASTLTSINPSDIAQAKKNLLREAKFLKFMTKECKTVVLPHANNIEKHFAFGYDKVIDKWSSFWKVRFDGSKYLSLINNIRGLKIIVETESN